MAIGITRSVVRAEIRSRHGHRRRSPREAIPDRHALPPRHRLAPRHLFKPSLAPPDRHVESQSLESQPEGRTLCTAWQGFLSVGAEGRSGVQKAAPGTPHKRDRQPPSFARCYGCQKNGPSSNCRPRRHGPTGRLSPLGLGEPVYLLFIRKAVASAVRGGGRQNDPLSSLAAAVAAADGRATRRRGRRAGRRE